MSLVLTHIHKTYPNGVAALNDVHLQIGKGMFGLLGPNGAGKSSLMKTIAGLLRPDRGSISLDGVDVVADPQHLKRRLGYLPQDFGVYPRLSAYELLNHIALLKGITHRGERKAQILALLDQTNLFAHRNREVHSFSGGMRQRFGIAQALLGQPRLLIVDEPTAGLDPEERNRFNNLLSAIGEDIVVLLSTHIVEDVRNLCQDMAILHQGRICAWGKPDDLIARLDGKIWHKPVSKAEHADVSAAHQVLCTQLRGGRLHLHVYAETQPGEGFVAGQASLEDLYFSVIQAGGRP